MGDVKLVCWDRAGMGLALLCPIAAPVPALEHSSGKSSLSSLSGQHQIGLVVPCVLLCTDGERMLEKYSVLGLPEVLQ